MVVMKGKWQHGIYILLRNIVMGILAVSSDSNQDNYCVELWHYRLSHMSEHRLTALSKRGLLKGG